MAHWLRCHKKHCSACDAREESLPFYPCPPPAEVSLTFRINKLSKLLVSGYCRMQTKSAIHFPDVIQSLIAKYINMFLVRLNYNVPVGLSEEKQRYLPKILSLPSGVTMLSLAQFLERKGPFKYDYDSLPHGVVRSNAPFLRLWARFKMAEVIYLNGSRYYTVRSIMAMEKAPRRWVEIPNDCMIRSVTTFEDGYDDVSNEDPIEFGVEFYDLDEGAWRSRKKYHWTNQLQVGDIIDVKDDQGKWYESLILCIEGPDDERKLFVHYIGWNSKYDELLSAVDSARIQKRGTMTKGPYYPNCPKTPTWKIFSIKLR